MTATHPDRAAFVCAIAASPECVATRGAYADWLDEHGESIETTCLGCKGKKGWMNPTSGYREFSGSYPRWENCSTCSGTGTVRTNTDADLAEYIRLQMEIDRPTHKHTQSLYNRRDALLATHPEWRTYPCSECGGSGIKSLVGYNPCPMCRNQPWKSNLFHNLTVDFDGVLYTVTAPTLETWVIDRGTDEYGYRHHDPTRRLRAVAAVETVAGVLAADREPGQFANTLEWFWCPEPMRGRQAVRYVLPPPVLVLMGESKLTPTPSHTFPTRAAALAALARALKLYGATP